MTRTRSVHVTLTVALAGLCAALGVFACQTAGTGSGPAAPSAREPRPEAAAADARRGRIYVTVVPWGKVWVDGRYAGRAPVDMALPVGAHRVAAGAEQPTVSRRVQVALGERQNVELELR